MLNVNRMTRVWQLVVAPLVLGAVVLLAAPVDAADAGPPLQRCVTIRAEVRYGAAEYNHIVVLTNACDKAEQCAVTTDVNPEPVNVTVPGHGTAEAVTFLGSPARTFVPKAVCTPLK